VRTVAGDDDSALERAEDLVKRAEEDAPRIARSAFARAVEFAEDIWTEAQSARKETQPER
jgi:vacuolar-type H+-ATPase subunit H